jgi:hypothetical protein
VIVEYEISNITSSELSSVPTGGLTLRDVYVGVYTSVLVEGPLGVGSGWPDDIVEFVPRHTSAVYSEIEEDFNSVLMMDNDGDPQGGVFDWTSVPDAVAMSLLRSPSKELGVSFNWWAYSSDPSLDWGPVKRSSTMEFPRGGLGHPLGDRSLYQMLANGEVDYPQMETAIDQGGNGWLPPPHDPSRAIDIANGNLVEFILGVGPLTLTADSSVTFAMAITGGRDLHVQPTDFGQYFDAMRPENYRQRVNVTDLLRNVQWAKWTYDNPGVDTDGDGYAGEWILRGGDTVYYRGDGVPDIRAALPPRTTALSVATRSHSIAIHWNGYRTETEKDVFTQRPDFEGYRVYMSRTSRDDEWSFVAQRDLVNYARYTWNAGRSRWEFKDPPFSLDSMRILYDALCDTAYGFLFHPDSFSMPSLDRALLEVHFDPIHPEKVDSIYRYFAPYEANHSPDDLSLDMAAEAGVDITGVIRKLYPQVSPTDTSYREDGTLYLPYYEYEYVAKDLQLAEPVFISVTAFDNGDPASGLEPLESAKSVTAKEVWPINDADVVKSERPKPGVYPNPYRLIDDYYGNNWENRKGLEPDRERARQITFYNVPDTCTVSIWTLDGDLVRKIHHAVDPSSSEATVVRWDLITRNTQAVKTGIYIWSIESRFGTDVGKLVIIK